MNPSPGFFVQVELHHMIRSYRGYGRRFCNNTAFSCKNTSFNILVHSDAGNSLKHQSPALHVPNPSHALLNMGLSEEDAHCTLGISLGVGNTETQIDQTLERMEEVIRESMTTVRFMPCR